MNGNVTSIRVYRKWWHGIFRRATDYHFIHETNQLLAFDVKGKKWLAQRLSKTKATTDVQENATENNILTQGKE